MSKLRPLLLFAVALATSCVRLSAEDRRWPCSSEKSECPDGQVCTDVSLPLTGGDCGFGSTCECLPKNYCNYDGGRGLLELRSCQEGEICSDERCKKAGCSSNDDCAGWDGVAAVCADGKCRQGCSDDSYEGCSTDFRCFADPRKAGSDAYYCLSECQSRSDCPDGFECDGNGECVMFCSVDNEECWDCPDDECPPRSPCDNGICVSPPED